MARDFYINGEALVWVISNPATGIPTLTQLGLSADPIQITPSFKHKDINLDAWGEAPADVQVMLTEATVSMNLIHYDPVVLATCIGLTMGGYAAAGIDGTTSRAGVRLGGGVNRLALGNNYIGLNISAPISGNPWRFLNTYIADSITVPLGTEKSTVSITWRAIPYPAILQSNGVVDPAGVAGGVIYGATGVKIWDHGWDA